MQSSKPYSERCLRYCNTLIRIGRQPISTISCGQSATCQHLLTTNKSWKATYTTVWPTLISPKSPTERFLFTRCSIYWLHSWVSLTFWATSSALARWSSALPSITISTIKQLWTLCGRISSLIQSFASKGKKATSISSSMLELWKWWKAIVGQKSIDTVWSRW